MKKLWLLVVLALCFVLPCAAEEKPTIHTSGDYQYILLEDGTAQITDYTGKARRLEVPSELDGYCVTSIGNDAFGISSSLMSITLPEGITSIGDEAFFLCSSLTSITLPEGLTSIGDAAFDSCRDLTSIMLPEGLTSIGDGAFNYCESLTSITLPESLVTIGDNPFIGCDNLREIRVSPDHPVYATIEGVLFHKAEKKLICYPCGFTATEYVVPKEIIAIGNYAFCYCENLTSITLPEGMTSIGNSAFRSCSSLASITLPESLTSIGDRAFEFCESLTSITLLEGVTSIGDYAFYFCESLTSITLPEGITSIGIRAFGSCVSLTEITVARDSYAEKWCLDNYLVVQYAGEWSCSECGQINSRNFCVECGAAKPVERTECGSCAYPFEEGTAYKFCPECGAAQ